MHLLCTNTTELGKNFYSFGWQKQSKLFLHKAENIKIHLAIIKPLLNYSKMRSIFFPNGNFGPYYDKESHKCVMVMGSRHMWGDRALGKWLNYDCSPENQSVCE